MFLGMPYLVFQFRGTIRLIDADQARPASGLEMVDLAGQPLSLDNYRGKVILVNLWASWCGPCRREIPGLSRLQERLGPEGLVVLGVNVDELPAGRIREVSDDLGITYSVVVPTAPLTGSFRSSGVIPHTWLIDRSGRVRASHAGLATSRSFRRVSETLLSEVAGG